MTAHPAIRTGDQLTRGERAADVMRNRMGSWGFVFTFVMFMGGWMVANSILLATGSFDPYPYILLNLLLSTLAGLQGAILLIAAKRYDQISGELAAHDYSTNQKALEEIEYLKTILEALHGEPLPLRSDQ